MARHIVKHKVNTSVLPSEYTQLTYIRTNGAVFDTGVVTTGNTKVDITLMMKGLSGNYRSPFGAADNATWNTGFSLALQSGASYAEYLDDVTISINFYNSVKYNIVCDKEKVYVDGYDKTPSSRTLKTFTTNTMALGGRKTGNGSYINILDENIYSVKVYSDDVLSFDGIPAIRKSDGICGLFDLVSESFFISANTAQAIAGETISSVIQSLVVTKTGETPVVPSDYTQLQYILTSDTRAIGPYIDTGINAANITRFVLKGSCNESGSRDQMFLGTYSSGTSNFMGTSDGAGWKPATTPRIPGNYGVQIDCTLSTYSGTLTYWIGNITNELSFSSCASFYGFLTNDTLRIFGNADTTRNPINSKLYFLTLYNGDTVVFNGIPAKRNSDSVLGLYDTVSSTFLTNTGEGAFVEGPELGISITTHAIKTSEVSD